MDLIDNLDLSEVRKTLIRDEGVSEAYALEIEKYYKNFLKLHKLHPEKPIAPTTNIDKMWHQHIMHTQKYMEDCFAIFGHYLHHTPHIDGLDEIEDEKMAEDFLNTRELYEEAFGQSIFMKEELEELAKCKNKPKPTPPVCSGCSSSPSCSSGCGGGCGCKDHPTRGMKAIEKKFHQDILRGKKA